MLGLYAAECGLKLRLLRERGLHSTRDLAADDAAGQPGGLLTHDLNILLGHIGLPMRIRPNSRADRPRNATAAAAQLHELYRYGGLLTLDHERGLIETLRSILLDVEENLS